MCTIKRTASLTCCELSSVAAHLVPKSTFKQFAHSLALGFNLLPEYTSSRDTNSLTSKAEHRFKSLELLTRSEDNVAAVVSGECGSRVRAQVIHKLRELEYNSLAVALEAGAVESLYPSYRIA